MKNLFMNLYWVVKNPRKLFSLLLEKSDLKETLIILLLAGILNGIFYILNLKYLENQSLGEASNNVFIALYPFTMALLFLIRGSIGLIIATAWIKICFRYLNRDIKSTSIFSIMSYAMVPNLIFSNIFKLLWPDVLVAAHNRGKMEILYYKTSLAQLLLNLRETHQKIFLLLKSIELFGLWSFILAVIAVATMGRLSFKKSFLIVFLPWFFVMSLIVLA